MSNYKIAYDSFLYTHVIIVRGIYVLKIYIRGDSVDKHWFKRGVEHRWCKPAVIRNFYDGTFSMYYCLDGKKHREGLPAYICKSRDGSYIKTYSKEDKLHREDGPAIIKYCGATNAIYCKRYFIKDEEFIIPKEMSKAQIKMYLRSLVNI